MTNLLITAPGRVVAQPVSATEIPETGQVRVEVFQLGLCGSDYHLFAGTYAGPNRYPIRFGHEWAGRVVETGAGSSFAAGTWVTGDCSRWCGRCCECSWDRNLCRNIEKFGITVDGFASSQCVVREQYLYVAPEGLSPRVLALTELFAVAWRGVLRAETSVAAAGEVLIIGAGPLGIATGLILHHAFNVNRIVLLESIADRREVARHCLPECTFANALSLVSNGYTYSEARRLAQYATVFECAGTASAWEQALLHAAPHGRVVCLGICSPSTVRTDLVVTKALRLYGSIGGTGAFPAALSFLSDHAEKAERMITHEYSAQDAQRAFEQSLTTPHRIKVHLRFRETMTA